MNKNILCLIVAVLTIILLTVLDSRGQGYTLRDAAFVGAAGFSVASAGGGYSAYASTFDGAADYLGGNTQTGATDVGTMTISAWFKIAGSSGTRFTIICEESGGTPYFILRRDTDNKFQFFGRNAASTVIFNVKSTTTYTDTSWHHIFVSVDCAAGSLNMYVDGSDVRDTPITAPINDNIRFTQNYYVGADPSNLWNGCMTEVWMARSYLATSAISSFRDSGNHPVALGTGGEVSAVTPQVYMKLDPSNAGVNTGTGGNLTVNSGPYSSCTAP